MPKKKLSSEIMDIRNELANTDQKIEELKNWILTIPDKLNKVKSLIEHISHEFPGSSKESLNEHLKTLEEFRDAIQTAQHKWIHLDNIIKMALVQSYINEFKNIKDRSADWQIRWGEDYPLVEEAISHLHNVDKHILNLSRLGFTQDKIAKILGLSQSAIANRLWNIEEFLSMDVARRKVNYVLSAEDFTFIESFQKRWQSPSPEMLFDHYNSKDGQVEAIEIFVVCCDPERYTSRERRRMVGEYLWQSQSFRRRFYALYFVGDCGVLFCPNRELENAGLTHLRDMTRKEFETLKIKYSNSLKDIFVGSLEEK